MNTTVASLTASNLFGKRRVLLLFILPGLLIALAVLIRLLAGPDDGLTKTLLGSFAMSPLVPLLGLIIGTGVIGPEIDDGSIVYLLSKPISRTTIVLTKLYVAIGGILIFAALPVLFSGLIISGFAEGLATSFFFGALAAGIAYCALFMMLAVISRHAVIIGLIYAIIWETLVGAWVPGAKNISIGQWGLSITGELAIEGEVTGVVSFGVAVGLLAAVIALGTWIACQKARSLTLVETE